ncbi:MAG: UvrD-helicase domain-containing protein, partial [Rhodothermales bacterium]|nr:UvrD-helicase domain-containing protein [Rhodothermales bacterium]
MAITFTRMAAGEMRARFAERLRDAAGSSERAHEALRRIDRTFVGTIHAFCARILRERPLDVGLRPDFTEVDEHEVTILWRRYWREELQRLYSEADPRIDRLAEVGVDVRELYDFFVTRSENSDLSLNPGLTEPPDMSPALEQVEAILGQVRAMLGGRIPDERDSFLDNLDLADHIHRNRGVDGPAAQAGMLRLYKRGIRGLKQKSWPDPALAKRVKNEVIGTLVEEIIDPALSRWRQYVYGLVAPLVDDIVSRFAEYRRERGLVTFHDLLVLTAGLLRESADAREFFQTKYCVFFVDEFQDTDPLQAEIISYLVGAQTKEADWRSLTPLPGRLFVVGDEKQSIYRFRRADIDVFRLVRDRILESGGRVVKLTSSFRSEPGLCEWINNAFDPLFDAQDKRYQASYDDIVAARSTDDPRPPVVRITTDKVHRNREETIVVSEADRVGDYILSEIVRPDGGVARSPGDFMLLTRRRKHLARYAAALEKRGIPYDIVGGDSLGDSEELKSLVTMLEAIRRPADEVAMLSYLRGPLIGLGDDDLYAFSRAGGRFRSD